MNLLKGFSMHSDKMRQEPASPDMDKLALPDSDLSGEPTLEEILSDPVVRSIMDKDHVSSAELVRIVTRQDRTAA
jgi:hypothetical protein